MVRAIDGPYAPAPLSHDRPTPSSERLSAWLAYGTVAVLLDGLFYVLSTVLELKNWGRAGLTPDAVVGYVAILPEVVVLICYLHVAREVTSRGLWKGAVGFFACGWLGQLLLLVEMEILNQTVAFAISLVAGVGILGLIVLLFGKWPAWRSTVSAGAGTSPAGTRPSDGDSAAAGCLIHLVLAVIFVLIRLLLKNANQWLPGGALNLGTWTFLEFLALLALIVVYGTLFPVAKIRHRRQLGSVATVLGVVELLTVAFHVTMLMALLVLTVAAVMANPQINEAQFNRQFEPMIKAGSVVSAAAYTTWALVTAWFFMALRKRYEPDWREDLLRV